MNGIINTLQEQKIIEIGDALKSHIGGRVTLFKFSGIGIPASLQFTLESVEISKYAQYDNALKIALKQRGGRTLKRCILHAGDEFAFFDGWRTTTEKVPNSFMCFDRSLFYKIVDGVQDGEKIGELSERVYKAVADEMPRVFLIVDENGANYYETRADLEKVYTIKGEFKRGACRAELQNAPIIDGLLGPMYDGERNGAAVIRYESQDVYDTLSN